MDVAFAALSGHQVGVAPEIVLLQLQAKVFVPLPGSGAAAQQRIKLELSSVAVPQPQQQAALSNQQVNKSAPSSDASNICSCTVDPVSAC